MLRMVLTTGLAFAALFTAICLSTFAQQVIFRFDPPDGLTYVQHLTITEITTVEGLATRTDITTSRTEVSVRESDTGFTVTASPSKIEFTRDGEKMENPLLPLLEKLVISIETDREGQVLAVRGYERLATLMDSLLPPAVSVTLSGQFTEESMVSDEIYEWNDHFADLVGWDFMVGDISVGAVLIGFENGEEITSLLVTQITDTTNCESTAHV